MNYSNIDILEAETRTIDSFIAQKIQEIVTSLCVNLTKDTNIIDTSELIKTIKRKNDFIQQMLKNGFAKEEFTLSQKMPNKHDIPKSDNYINNLANSLLIDRISKTLEQLLQEATSPLEICTIFSRKLFFESHFGTIASNQPENSIQEK